MDSPTQQGIELDTSNPQPSSLVPVVEDPARVAAVDEFLALHSVIANKKKRRNLIALPTNAFESYKLGVIVSICCKAMDLDRAYAAYCQAKESGITPSQDTFTNLLSLTAGLGDQGSSLAPPREIEPPQNMAAALVVFEDMKSHEVKIHESSYTAMIRCCSMNGHANQALSLYNEMRTHELTPKLRTFSPLLAAFAKFGSDANRYQEGLEICYALFNDMTSYSLIPTEREYLSMLRLLISASDVILALPCTSSGTMGINTYHSIQSVEDRLYNMLEQFMEDVLVPTDETWSVLRLWFSSSRGFECQRVSVTSGGHFGCSESQHDACQEKVADLKAKTMSAPMSSLASLRLKSIDIDQTTQQALLAQIEGLAVERAGNKAPDNGHNSKAPPSLSNKAKDPYSKWAQFKIWLDAARHPTEEAMYDVVIDGANCGYYKQNYAGAPSHIDYHQVNWMLRQLQSRGLHPLLVLHSRHTINCMNLSVENSALVEQWRNDKVLLETPSGWNDDWYWLYTAIALGCKVVTNDEMRDHHFQMLAPRCFSRWKERRQVRFAFGSWAHCTIPGTTASGSADDAPDGSNVSPDESESEGQILLEFQRTLPSGSTAAIPANGSCSTNTTTWCRRAVLTMPQCYSHRSQCLESRRCYAFPAVGQQEWLLAVPTSPIADDVRLKRLSERSSTDTGDSQTSAKRHKQ